MKRILVSLLVITGTLRAMQHAAPSTVQVRCSDGVVLTVPRDILERSRVLRNCLGADSKESQLIPLEHVNAADMRFIITVLARFCGVVEAHERVAVVRQLLLNGTPAELENVARCADYLDIPELHSIALQMLFDHAGTPKAFLEGSIGNADVLGYQDQFALSNIGNSFGYFEKSSLRQRSCVYSVAWSPDGKQVITGNYNNTAKIWDVATGRLVHILQHQGWVFSVAWSPDGKQVITGCSDNTAKIWDVVTGTLVHTLQHNDWACSVAWSPDGKQVITGCDDCTAKIWDVATGRLVHTLQHNDLVYSVAWSPDGKQVITGSRDCTAKIWDVATGTLVRTLQPRHWVLSLAWSPDGKQVIMGASDNTAKIWDVATGTLVRTLQHRGLVRSVAWSPDGKQVVTGCDDFTAKIWDVATGTLIHTLQDRSWVRSVAWSPDGKLVIAGGDDGRAKIWDIRLPGCEVLTYRNVLLLAWIASLNKKNIDLDAFQDGCYSGLPDATKQALETQGYVFTHVGDTAAAASTL